MGQAAKFAKTPRFEGSNVVALAPGPIGCVLACLMWPVDAAAHVSEQALVLLLPTGHYITAGVLSVLASIILISLAPKPWVDGMFRPAARRFREVPPQLALVLSLVSLCCFIGLVFVGITGPRDPLTNLLPLTIWTGFWITFFALCGLFGDFWRVLNPWSGLYALVFGRGATGLMALPAWLGAWPGVLVFLGFAIFYVIDPAPEDPDRLAVIVLAYWGGTFAMMALFGEAAWRKQGEAFSILFALLARVSPLGGEARPGLPGWALMPHPPLHASLGVFSLVVLGAGSFDGLKETFWWLGLIGVNPLEFPGRTAVMVSSLLGVLAATVVLCGLFCAVIWAGARLAGMGQGAGRHVPFPLVFASFAPTVLPIALGYHISHFMIAFMVGGQYLLAAIGDPLATGANFFGLGDLRVTTGFLGTPQSVERIWLTQAVCVVMGHILSVLAAHKVALSLFETPRRAALSQVPIGLFMALFTLFGLWLLATPRGM